MAGMDISVRPATPDEIQARLPRLAADYAGEIAASGSLPPDQAQAKAHREVSQLLAEADGAPNQVIFRLVAGQQPVGWLWLTVPAPGGDPAMAWVNDVEVDEAFRGRGYGRQAMLLAEQEAGVRGMTSVGLNVHGSNAAARALYESLGYQVTSQQMKKPL
jgi:ribosomal protein S18 acetylase RimI-like enzyme